MPKHHRKESPCVLSNENKVHRQIFITLKLFNKDKGVRTGLNRHLRLHRPTCRNHYTTNTMHSRTRNRTWTSPLGPGRDLRFTIRERKERELNPQGRCKNARPASNRFPSPFGLPFRNYFNASTRTCQADDRGPPSSSLSVGGGPSSHVRSGA